MVYSNTHVLFCFPFCFSHVCNFPGFDIILAGLDKVWLQADDLIQSVPSISPSLWISGHLSPFMMRSRCAKGETQSCYYISSFCFCHILKNIIEKTRHIGKTEVKGQGNTPAVGRGWVFAEWKPKGSHRFFSFAHSSLFRHRTIG